MGSNCSREEGLCWSGSMSRSCGRGGRRYCWGSMSSSWMGGRSKANAASFLSGFKKGVTIFEAKGSDLRFKFVGWTSPVEHIVGSTAV